MKRTLLVVSVLSLMIVGESVSAAKLRKEKASLKASKGFSPLSHNTAASSDFRSLSVNPVVTSPTQSPAASSPKTTTPSLNGATTTSATVAAPSTTAIKRFSLTWVSYNALNMQGLTGVGTDREFYAWEQPTFKYNIDANWNLGVMPQFTHTWFGDMGREQIGSIAKNQLSQSYGLYMNNLAFSVTNKNIAMLPGNIKFNGQLRFDAPTSEFSQKAGTIGETWLTLGFSRAFGKAYAKLNYIGQYYLQQYETSLLVDNEGNPLRNNQYRQFAWLDVGYNFTNSLSCTLSYGTKSVYKHADLNTARSETLALTKMANVDVSYSFTNAFTLSAGFYDDGSPLDEPRMPFDANSSGGGGELYIAGTFNI